MRSHGPSCKRWRCSMQLLFHFPCWTWSITLNGKLAQSSLTSWSPPSLLSFVATFLFTDFPLCPDRELLQTTDPMQGAQNLLSKKSSFAQNAFQLRELCPFFPGNGARKACWRSLAPRFVYRKRTVRVAFPLEYSPKVYQSVDRQRTT